MRVELDRAGLKIEYATVRDASSLRPISSSTREGRSLIAVWCGGVRLIDNAPWHVTT
jgi:pantothenate synthetase